MIHMQNTPVPATGESVHNKSDSKEIAELQAEIDLSENRKRTLTIKSTVCSWNEMFLQQLPETKKARASVFRH